MFESLKPATLILCLGGATMIVGCSRAPDDRQIAAEVGYQIRQNSAIHSGMQAESDHGTVTLFGRVEADAERMLASRDAADLRGVKQVVNNLTVVPAAPSPTAPEPVSSAARRPAPGFASGARDISAGRNQRRRDSQTELPHADNIAVKTPAPALPTGSAPSPEPAIHAAVSPPPTQPPALIKHTIPAGTIIFVRLIDRLDSSRNRVGDIFRATLQTPIRENGELVIPTGANVEGRVVDVSNAGRFSGHSQLHLKLTTLSYQGELYALQTESYGRTDKGRGKGTAESVSGGAALGVMI